MPRRSPDAKKDEKMCVKQTKHLTEEIEGCSEVPKDRYRHQEALSDSFSCYACRNLIRSHPQLNNVFLIVDIVPFTYLPEMETEMHPSRQSLASCLSPRTSGKEKNHSTAGTNGTNHMRHLDQIDEKIERLLIEGSGLGLERRPPAHSAVEKVDTDDTSARVVA
jgi:hypothetical protein